MDSLFAQNSPFQIVVNSARLDRPRPLVEIEDEAIDAVLNLNAKAGFYVTRAATRGMLAAGLEGSIINVSSQMDPSCDRTLIRAIPAHTDG